MIPRAIEAQILQQMKGKHKIVVIYGARQTGKTTLVKEIIVKSGMKSITVNADQQKYLDLLSSRDVLKIRMLTGDSGLLFIDEAQRIPEIGLNLKIIHDEIPGLAVLVTGSSSLDLADKIAEPLTGRKKVFTLFPVSIMELSNLYSPFELHERLEQFLIFGCYPEVLTAQNNKDKETILAEIGSSYLFKDIFELLNLRHRDKIYDLLRLLAFQVGSEVSLHELSNTLRINRESVEKYLHLLEETFIIYKLKAFSRNLRKEVSKMSKYYFYDIGIRNYLINNFNPLSYRNDTGQLWENFLFMERTKYLAYSGISMNTYFWRIYTGAELDYVEEGGGQLIGYEFKFTKPAKKPPQAWMETYHADFKTVNQENYLSFVT
ncbi:MAG: ATP-binding protein [Bacteroidia bacterium]|nr:ATP-binding protein [Bacteroidia bacterium]